VLHNNALGLKITGLDIDGDNDIDLSISDRFLGQHIGIWLNDGKGRFIKSLPGFFSPGTNAHLAFVAEDRNFAGQGTGVRERRRLPDYIAATRYIQPLPLNSSTLNRHPVEATVHFAVDPLEQRPPPTTLVV